MIQLFYFYSDWALLVLRLAVGLILVAHGWPKIKDLKTTAQNFDAMGFKPGRLWGTIAALLEFFGGLLMIIGWLTQVAASLLVLEFIVIMLWRFKRKDKLVGGFELDLILLASLLTLAATGSSVLALDNWVRVYLF